MIPVQIRRISSIKSAFDFTAPERDWSFLSMYNHTFSIIFRSGDWASQLRHFMWFLTMYSCRAVTIGSKNRRGRGFGGRRLRPPKTTGFRIKNFLYLYRKKTWFYTIFKAFWRHLVFLILRYCMISLTATPHPCFLKYIYIL